MQTDSKDYLVQLKSDVSAIIIQEPGFLLQRTFRVALKLAIRTLAA